MTRGPRQRPTRNSFMRVLAGALSCLVVAAALAHKPSDSYLTLRVEDSSIEGQWDIALRDLDYVLGLDDNQDGSITWGEVRAHQSAIAAYALARLALSEESNVCPTRVREHLIDRHSDGAYAVLRFVAQCADPPDSLTVKYALLFEVDPQHRGLLRIAHGGQTWTAIFSADGNTQQIVLAEPGGLTQFAQYIRHGVWHIWTGFDHILFLLSLLLPAVLLRAGGEWHPAERFSDAFWDVFKVVTAFTIAHSVTLSLAALSIISLPSRWVESAIAASVVLAALNNLKPVAGERRWMIAFAFGLIHGFGFASVLVDLGLPRGSLLLALVAFNLGVELGQLAIVAAFLPMAWMFRRTWFYQKGILIGGSVLVAALATVWLVQRALDIKFGLTG